MTGAKAKLERDGDGTLMLKCDVSLSYGYSEPLCADVINRRLIKRIIPNQPLYVTIVAGYSLPSVIYNVMGAEG